MDDGLSYRRVSDSTQSGDQAQLNNLRRLATLHAVNVVKECFDEGESGDDLSRPGLSEVVEIVESRHRQGRPLKWILLDQNDRLSRADSLDTAALLANLRKHGI